jgi:hypothetical protein
MTTRGEAQGLLPDTCLTEHWAQDRWETKVHLIAESPLQMADNIQQLPDCLTRKTAGDSRHTVPSCRVPPTHEGSETKLMSMV